MRTVQAVAWKEILVYFGSPMAYIVGLIFLAVTGYFFTRDLGNPFPEASLGNFYTGATIILILLAPALTLRLLAEEQKLGTIELLLTSPVRDDYLHPGALCGSSRQVPRRSGPPGCSVDGSRDSAAPLSVFRTALTYFRHEDHRRDGSGVPEMFEGGRSLGRSAMAVTASFALTHLPARSPRDGAR